RMGRPKAKNRSGGSVDHQLGQSRRYAVRPRSSTPTKSMAYRWPSRSTPWLGTRRAGLFRNHPPMRERQRQDDRGGAGSPHPLIIAAGPRLDRRVPVLIVGIRKITSPRGGAWTLGRTAESGERWPPPPASSSP